MHLFAQVQPLIFLERCHDPPAPKSVAVIKPFNFSFDKTTQGWHLQAANCSSHPHCPRPVVMRLKRHDVDPTWTLWFTQEGTRPGLAGCTSARGLPHWIPSKVTQRGCPARRGPLLLLISLFLGSLLIGCVTFLWLREKRKLEEDRGEIGSRYFWEPTWNSVK